MSYQFDVVGIGNPTLDILHTPEGTKYAFGGSATNVIVNLARLGKKTGIIGNIGRDRYGEEIKSDLLEEGVDISHLIYTDRTHICTIEVTPTERKITGSEFYRPVRNLTDADREYLASSRSAYARVDHRVFRTCAEILQDIDGFMVVSLHGVEPSQKKIEALLASRINALFANEEEVEKFLNEVKEIKKKGTIIAVTRGSLGCEIHYKGNQQSYPAFKVNAVDPTGAGDAFAAGFIYGFLHGWDMDKTAYFANACGVLITTEYGARTVRLTEQSVLDFIERQR